MHIELIAEVIIAMFAMYGVFCAIGLLCELFYKPSSFTLAVFAKRGESAEETYKKLCYATLVAARERGAKACPIIIADESYAENEEKAEELKKTGAAIYTAKEL